MKIAVTGHSDGLGKAIADRLTRDGHEIVGFSLDNGYNISKEEDFRRIISESIDCDSFVNCAHDRERNNIEQVQLLLAMFHRWQDEEKHIICVGSNAPDTYGLPVGEEALKYRAAKAALDAATLEINSRGKPCRVTIVRPGWIDSKAVTSEEERLGVKFPKLERDEVADIVAMIVELGARVTITSITLKRTLRASKQRKEWWGK